MSERGLNSVSLIGRLGRDPETRHSQSGTTFADFSLAIAERRKKGDEWIDHTEWVNCVTIGKTAETVSKHVTKGSRLYVEGKIQTRKWQDKEGATRYATEVLVREILFLGDSAKAGARRQEQAPESEEVSGFAPDDD